MLQLAGFRPGQREFTQAEACATKSLASDEACYEIIADHCRRTRGSTMA